MNNPLIYFIGLLTIVIVASLILVTAQENNNVTLNNTIQNNTTLIKTTQNFLDVNKTFVNESKPKEIGPIVNLSVNTSADLYKVTIRENGTLNNTTQNNTSMNNMGLDLTSLNKTTVDANEPEKGNNLSTNVSTNFYTTASASNETVFDVGDNGKAGEQVFDVGLPIKPAKDASKMGYIIQATPHGTV
ncbi:MAG: hypothetical protein LUQ38_10570 [Methanotrichaceae archaeon]|nr:hypothetical protein [Methanotrichaceae archaeon]